MHVWTVASAVIESSVLPGARSDEDGSVLLVRNLRVNGTADWTPPGGVVDEGEVVLEGLAREVVEETGLVVTSWSGLLYEIRVVAPDLGWDLRVEVHRASAVLGELAIGDDPDGIVIGSAWAETPECERLLGDGHPWVREPLVEWLRERWAQPRRYQYRIHGSSMDDFRVTRGS